MKYLNKISRYKSLSTHEKKKAREILAQIGYLDKDIIRSEFVVAFIIGFSNACEFKNQEG